MSMGEKTNMDTNEIITELRDWAIVQGPGSLAEILNVAADKIEELDERVTIMSEPHGWISVKDRLPEQGKTVLVARKYVQPGHKERRYVETAELIGASWVSIEDEYKMHRQFHTLPYAWMPLPEPPKEEHDEP